jgi:hypothetical protein
VNGAAVAAVDHRRRRNRNGRHQPSPRHGWIGFGLGLVCAALNAVAATVPSVFRSGPGRFEVSALDAAAARAATTEAEECWRWLSAPLALPEQFSSPVFVRLVPASEWSEPTPFRTIVEAGGVVSLRVSAAALGSPRLLRRALVQALLMRLAVAQRGVNARLSAPLWLEQGCVGWWETRADAAHLDAVKQRSAALAPPAVDELLQWQRGEPESPARVSGALWLLTCLQAETTRAGEWPALLRALLSGDEPMAALASHFPGRFTTAAGREMWWQLGWHHARRTRTLPTLEIDESRAELAALARFVVAHSETDADRVITFREALAHAREPFVDAELARRAADANRLAATLHPFFRNAGLSLAGALATGRASPAQREAACLAFERDWTDAGELAAASRHALDTLERQPRPAITP